MRFKSKGVDMKVIDCSIINANKAVVMVQFDDGGMGAANVQRAVSGEFFEAKAHRHNFEPDRRAATFANQMIMEGDRIDDINTLKKKLMG